MSHNPEGLVVVARKAMRELTTTVNEFAIPTTPRFAPTPLQMGCSSSSKPLFALQNLNNHIYRTHLLVYEVADLLDPAYDGMRAG